MLTLFLIPTFDLTNKLILSKGLGYKLVREGV